MRVLHRLVNVPVLVLFGQMQPRANRHHQAGGDQLQGQRLTQESDGNDRAKKWRRREIGCGARGTEVAQGPDEKR